MDEAAAPVQLIDHLRRMFDQIAILLLQAMNIHHPLLDLRKRSLEVRCHLIERIGEPFNFISGLQLKPPVQSSASDFTHPVV